MHLSNNYDEINQTAKDSIMFMMKLYKPNVNFNSFFLAFIKY